MMVYSTKPDCFITGSEAHIVWEVYAYMSCHYCLILAHLLIGFLALYESFNQDFDESPFKIMRSCEVAEKSFILSSFSILP